VPARSGTHKVWATRPEKSAVTSRIRVRRVVKELWIEKGRSGLKKDRNLWRPFFMRPGREDLRSLCSRLAKRSDLVVQHPRFGSGGSGEAEPVFFDIEKHHGIGDDGGGVLMAAEINLALDAIPGGHIKDEIFRRCVVSQGPVLCG
jgi:hypothetical protein